MPNGMPPQYTPWLPVDNYFRQNPTTVNIWVNIWNNWQVYAPQHGYQQYDFNRFWFEYCPNNYPQYMDVWNYFDTNVYWWVQPNSQFQCEDPTYFWQYYQGMPYSGVDDYCGGGCF
jgi:hypothetical protein